MKLIYYSVLVLTLFHIVYWRYAVWESIAVMLLAVYCAAAFGYSIEYTTPIGFFVGMVSCAQGSFCNLMSRTSEPEEWEQRHLVLAMIFGIALIIISMKI